MDIKPSDGPILKIENHCFISNKELDLYIPPQVGRYIGDNNPQAAADAISLWLKNTEKKCLLLLGDSGAGKTLFGKWLCYRGQELNILNGYIPLFIPLYLMKNYIKEKKLIDGYLKKFLGIKDENQRIFFKKQPLLLILDGFDEIYLEENLYDSNELWKLENAKIIISCRSQSSANIADYHKNFYPYDKKNKERPEQLQEYIINPFTEIQIDDYIRKYIDQKKDQVNNMGYEIYQEYIKKIPGLQQLLNSPFVLSIFVQVLPLIIEKYKDEENIQKLHLARINLYDYFIQQWFVRQKKKLLDAGHIKDDCPIEKAFEKYSELLAYEMLKKKITSVEYVAKISADLVQIPCHSSELDANSKEPWLSFFLEKKCIVGRYFIDLSLIRAGCPLVKLGENQYAFLHKSLLEYFATRKIFKGIVNYTIIALGSEPLNERLFINEPGALKFMAEKVEQDDTLKQRLLDIVEESKCENQVEIASANAITVLNYARVSLSQKNFSRICIKGADLSEAVLDGTDFQYADLREVNMKGAWLNNAKFNDALMEGIYFGELAYLQGKWKNEILSVAYSPDGRWLAAGDKKGYIDIYKVGKNKIWATLDNRDSFFTDNPVYCIDFSPDSENLIAGSKDGKVRLWNIQKRKLLYAILAHEGEVNSVSFNACDVQDRRKIFASGGDDKKICIWETLTGKRLSVIQTHNNIVTNAIFISFKNKVILVSGSVDRTVQAWDIEANEPCNAFPVLTFKNEINCLAFSWSSNLLAVGEDGKSLSLYDLSTFRCVNFPQEYTNFIKSLAFSPNGKFFAFVDQSRIIYLWDIPDVSNIKLLATYKGHINSVTNLTFSFDGEFIVSASYDKTIRFWQAANLKNALLDSHTNIHTQWITSVAFQDKDIFVTGSIDKTIRLWNAKTGKSIYTFRENFPIISVAFSQDFKILAAGDINGVIHLWNIATKEKISILEGHTKVVNYVAFNARFLVSGSDDGTVYLRDSLSHNSVKILKHLESVTSIAFHPYKEDIIFVGSDDGRVNFWNIETEEKLYIRRGHENKVNSVIFSPNLDDKIFATASDDFTIRLWDSDSYVCKLILRRHTRPVISIAFSHDGKMLASGSNDCTLCIWDSMTGKHLTQVSLPLQISALHWVPDMQEQNYLVVASGNTAYCFEVKSYPEKLSIILVWRTDSIRLMAEKLELGGVVGLDKENENLLKQLEAVGTSSTKETNTVLRARNQMVPYSKSYPRDLFKNVNFIMPNNALVSIARKKYGKGSIHVFLVIEYINKFRHYTIIQADFFLEKRWRPARGDIFDPGQALIEICTKPLSEMQILSQKCVYKSWVLSDDQVYTLIANLKADRLKYITYVNVGNNILYRAIKPDVENHNCLTWCIGHLNNIGLDISEKSLQDYFVLFPHQYLPLNQEDTPHTVFPFWASITPAVATGLAVGAGVGFCWALNKK